MGVSRMRQNKHKSNRLYNFVFISERKNIVQQTIPYSAHPSNLVLIIAGGMVNMKT
jgi:hypothetical protein